MTTPPPAKPCRNPRCNGHGWTDEPGFPGGHRCSECNPPPMPDPTPPFRAHPGPYHEDRSGEMESPSCYRAGWRDAVNAILKRTAPNPETPR
jgi:hypothetical protein